ncbi:MAG: phage tail protein [Saprospiraceae bacterium]|nr:phage tail protein [Saprospiraceae bacterium]MCC7505210.1 phage tail protein [Saprospiraceae bacterium]
MDPFVAEIRIVGFNFAPKGWAQCNGQILPISQNTALFSLLGTTYGGDGKSTFALPDLQGCVPMQPGQGPGLSYRDLGESGGSESVTLVTAEMPMHNHGMMAANFPGDVNNPTGNALARSTEGSIYSTSTAPAATLAFNALAQTGMSSAHNNMQPYLTLMFVIAMQGVFPPRN